MRGGIATDHGGYALEEELVAELRRLGKVAALDGGR